MYSLFIKNDCERDGKIILSTTFILVSLPKHGSLLKGNADLAF
jgi:hypothetical protein